MQSARPHSSVSFGPDSRQTQPGILCPFGSDGRRCAILAAIRMSIKPHVACFMTSRLRQMGAYRTNFETASGLPEPGQYTTAYDLALIFRKAMENPTLAKVMSTKTYTLTDGKEVRNHNRFLFTTDYAVAGKTGWTRSSQHTYVGMFQNGEKRIIISLLGSPNKWPDLRILIAKGFSEMGAPIAALPPLEERLRKTEDGYALAGDDSLSPARGRSKV